MELNVGKFCNTWYTFSPLALKIHLNLMQTLRLFLKYSWFSVHGFPPSQLNEPRVKSVPTRDCGSPEAAQERHPQKQRLRNSIHSSHMTATGSASTAVR